MTPSHDEVLVISPEWELVRNGSRVILLHRDASTLKYQILSRAEALAATLFDGSRSVTQVTSDLAFLLDAPPELCSQKLQRFTDRLTSTEFAALLPRRSIGLGDFPKYNPQDFLSAKAKVDYPHRLEVPLSVGLTFTHRCHTNCVYCYAERRQVDRVSELSLAEWRSVIRQVHNAGIRRTDIFGGDIFARQDAVELLSEMVTANFEFFVSTKCHLDERLISRLQSIGIDKRTLQVSIDSDTPAIADAMVNTPGFHQRTMESVRLLINRGFRLRLKAVLTPYNINTARSSLASWYAQGVRHLMFIDYGRSFYRHSDVHFCSPDASKSLRNYIDEFVSDHPDMNVIYGAQAAAFPDSQVHMSIDDRWEKWRRRARCSGGASSMIITADGRVSLCEQMPQSEEHLVGNIRNQSLLEIWNSQRLLDYVYPSREAFAGTGCYDCAEFHDCHRRHGHCFRDALLLGGSKYLPNGCPVANTPPRMS